MTELEEDDSKLRRKEQNFHIYEYNAMMEDLKGELNFCKAEQVRLRSELEMIRDENRHATEMTKEYFSHFQEEHCHEESQNAELLTSMEKRLTIVQMEKDSMFQLWQMALKAIDVLEQELKSCRKDDTSVKCYEEQVAKVKESYSEAINTLEAKLVQAKENFFKHQTLWESGKKKVDELSNERDDLLKKIAILQEESQQKEETLKKKVDSIKSELTRCQAEMEHVKGCKEKLEEKLNDVQKFVANVIAKDNETKSKMSEALELVESAIREKDQALQRESFALEEKYKLEQQMANVAQEYASSLEKEISKINEAHENNIKKYNLEIEELKLELRQKATLLDRAQRESRLMEEELEKTRCDSEVVMQKANGKIIELEQKLKETEFKLKMCEETGKIKCKEKCQSLEQQVKELEDRLLNSNEILRKVNIQSSHDVQNRIKEADERTKEALERYSNLERRLSRTLDDREKISVELQSLQGAFERETEKRDHERKLLEMRIRDLQEDLRAATNTVDRTTARGDMLAGQISSLENEIKRRSEDKLPGTESCFILNPTTSNVQLQISKLQEKYDKKIEKLTQHVEVHQKLSQKWKEEAKLLTTKFQKRSKELRNKIIALRNENEELNRELLSSRQQLAQCRIQTVTHNSLNFGYDQGNGIR